MLVHFFQKYPAVFTEKYAVKCMHKKLECAEKKLKENPHDISHYAYLKEVAEMIGDYFDEKGINPDHITVPKVG